MLTFRVLGPVAQDYGTNSCLRFAAEQKLPPRALPKPQQLAGANEKPKETPVLFLRGVPLF